MPLHFTKLEIPEVRLISPDIYTDNRGIFAEVYKRTEFEREGIYEHFEQDNFSGSKKDVLRGLHYQIPPMAHAKVVRCIKGKVFDVAIDLRKNSPTFGKWVGTELSEENHLMLYIPEFCAHGFVVLSDYAEVAYKCSRQYSPQHERGVIWNDPDICISWPVREPILSEKDKKLPRLKDAVVF